MYKDLQVLHRRDAYNLNLFQLFNYKNVIVQLLQQRYTIII
jgi:hypothetical protein